MGNLEKSISSADRLICMMKNELHNAGIEPADPPAHSCKQKHDNHYTIQHYYYSPFKPYMTDSIDMTCVR